ncbi:PiggyBac transposase uribo2 [Plakobranchus ocellatus]|uniref:PiggyBac transposase uribo2 n=1 Tax=Plakobranchus ocellatus TaxID=259542 RepID=A0AAV4AVH6_9GAST|nr:PiggyBac transposase uribo2 [Plakobranchus ocellatus]
MQDLDADDDDAVDKIDIEMVNTEWLEADPDFTPQLHDFEGDGGIKFDDTDFTEVDYVTQFLNEDFWNLLVIESNRKAKQFFDTHQDFSRRSIFLSWSDTNTEEMKKFIGLILLQGLVKNHAGECTGQKIRLCLRLPLLPFWIETAMNFS